MKARLSLLHKTEAEWRKFNNLIPEPGEVIIYDSDDNYNYVRLKVGDGKHYLHELDFFIDSTILATLAAQKYPEIIDAGRITDYK